MFDQVTVGVTDLAVSGRLYRSVLGTLGIEPSFAGEGRIEWDDFALTATDEAQSVTRHLHVGFVAPSRKHVDAFWRTGIEAGLADEGGPGERPHYTPGYYGAFLRDPDGNSVEAVRHDDVRRGGHVDHLWIRVGDLGAAVAFYTTIMPHVGLREGRRWGEGRQFRGAWATFSLVADGSPPTEGLQISFPAPDRTAVEDFHRAAIGAEGAEKHPPGERSDPPRFAASVLDPDGTEVESIFREG